MESEGLATRDEAEEEGRMKGLGELLRLRDKRLLLRLKGNLQQRNVEIETLKSTLSAQKVRLLKQGGDSRVREEFRRFLEEQQSGDTARHQQLSPLE